MKRIKDERLAEIEAVYDWQIDCGDLHITFQEMAEELLQAMKAERAVINAVEALPDKWRAEADAEHDGDGSEHTEYCLADELQIAMEP